MKLDPTTQKNIDIWLQGNIDPKSRKAVETLLATNTNEAVNAFYQRLTFGTGGLRGIMGVGTNRMNEYTIRMATQGLANYINKQTNTSSNKSVFIGFDSRHNSRFFAEEAAKVLAGNGITAHLCNELRPTPLISFGCRQNNCIAAIMITASHNPPEYNGYKVYWSDGGQVVPPQDKEIIKEVNNITSLDMVTLTDTLDTPLIKPVGNELDEAYLKAIASLALTPDENQKHGSKLKVVYTSLHGTGMTIIPETLKQWGFTSCTLVESQNTPDGDFPTVKSPNPEEADALKLGIAQLEKEEADILLGTDPDTDRVGIAVRHHGETLLMNGNQIASVCLYHICQALKAQGGLPNKAAFIKTIGTTELFKVIAEDMGGTCFDTLTGFKYIAELIRLWEEDPNGYNFVFGGEESYGYLLGTHARDKDAVISCALICEVASHAKQQGKTLIDLLHEVFAKYGVYHETLKSLKFPDTKEGQEQRIKGMELLRNNTPKTIGGVTIVTIEDYLTREKTDCRSKKKSKLTLPKSDVLLFWLEDGSKLMIRPSGTEPKIKIYCGVCEPRPEHILDAYSRCSVRAQDLISAMEELFTG